MKFPKLISGKLIKRYKRFLADIKLDNNEIVTVHCPNSGRMTTCIGFDWQVLLSLHASPKRKYKYTLEMIHNGKTWIVVNTNRANEVVYEAICSKQISEIIYPNILREKKYGKNSRIDIFANSETQQCYIEVKSVTLINDAGQYSFPDAPTERGQKHLNELMNMVEEGSRAINIFAIMREDGNGFVPEKNIDPIYSKLLEKAIEAGVECFLLQFKVTPIEITLNKYMKLKSLKVC